MKTDKWLKNTVIVCILASICSALWGSAFPFIKIGYKILEIQAGETGSQILFAGIRFTLAGVMTLMIGSFMAKRVLIPAVGSWINIVKLSLFQTIIQYVLFYVGLSHTTGVKASIIQGTNAFVALLIASIIFHQEKLTRSKFLGCVFGFAGVIIINMNATGFSADFKILGEGFIFLSTVASAFSSVLLKQYSKKDNPVLLCGYQFIVGGIIMMVIGFIMGGNMDNYTIKSISILIYLAFISAVSFSLWGILLKYNPVSKVTVFGFMTPVFGVVLSALLLKENQAIGYKCLISLILVSVGIYMVNYNKVIKDK